MKTLFWVKEKSTAGKEYHRLTYLDRVATLAWIDPVSVDKTRVEYRVLLNYPKTANNHNYTLDGRLFSSLEDAKALINDFYLKNKFKIISEELECYV